jgi:5-methylcytosine-specific restriction protein A
LMKRARSNAPALQPVSHSSADTACALCLRQVRGISRHHLVPKSEGGTVTVDLCGACHKTLHKFFTNRTLAKELNSIEALLGNQEVQRYVGWVRKQPDRAIRVRSSRKKRR